jgi:S-methylmethionine-dependent homocysteine/selenocysteine methylase
MNEKTTAGPPVLIYKTKQDYFQNVPVVLNEDKTSVVSFPAISDLMRNNAFTYPTLLENEFLLDNRGIAKNTAFITLTYEEYSRLEKTPTVDEILKLILDNDPFVVLYNCGSRYNYDDILSELNLKITTNKLNEFKKLK